MIALPRGLGLGGGPLGDPALADADVERLLAVAVEVGVALVDTAPSYGESEARIGRVLGHRPEVQLSTKVGYGIEGVADWTPRCITLGVERARQRLRRDVIDVVHLHSCPLPTLTDSGVVGALLEEKAQGRIRRVAYSGEGHALRHALAAGVFDGVQVSVSVVDQGATWPGNPHGVAGRGLLVVAKRALANGVSRRPWAPGAGPDVVEYRRRWELLALDDALESSVWRAGLTWPAALVRFAAFTPGVDVVLVGTGREENLRSAAAALEAGPLPEPLVAWLRARWSTRSQLWDGVV